MAQTSSPSRIVGIATAIWAASILASRLMGLVREQIIGRTLGVTREADLYFASFTLPDFLNYLLGAGALSIVFIPIVVAHLEAGDEARGWRTLSTIANVLLLACGLGTLLLMAFARPLVAVVAPGFTDADEVDTLVRLTRIVLPAQIFHVLGGLLSAALMARDRHALPALAPLVYSGAIIAGGLAGAHVAALGADGFAWGVLAGSVLGPFALPLAGCLRMGLRWSPRIVWRDPDLRRYVWLSLPIMVGFSVVIVDEWIIKNQASYLEPGALASLQYGRTLMKVPIGMFGMAAGVAAYPTLSRLVKEGDIARAHALLTRAVRLTLLAIFAAQVCLTVAGFEAVYVIWGTFSHRFTEADAQRTAVVLAFLVLGLPGWATQTLISRGFYALQSTWLPTAIGTAVAFAMVPAYVALRVSSGSPGLAVASALAITAYVLLLGWLQERRFRREAAARGHVLGEGGPGMLDGAVRLAASAGLATAAGLLLRAAVLPWLPGTGLGVILLRGALLCLAGLGVYAAAARLLRVPEVAALGAVLKAKAGRRRATPAA